MPSLNPSHLKLIFKFFLAISFSLTLFACSHDEPASGSAIGAGSPSATEQVGSTVKDAARDIEEAVKTSSAELSRGNGEATIAESKAEAEAEADRAASSTRKVDADIVSLYQKTCIACHLSGAAGAPRSHDSSAWSPRMAKGMAVLVRNVKDGFNGMPPKGACFNCSDDQYEALVQFMAGPKP